MEALYSSPVRIICAPVECFDASGRWDHYPASRSLRKIGLSGFLLRRVRSADGATALIAPIRSVGIRGIFGVQDTLHLLEMSLRKIGELLPILRGPLGDIVGEDF